jgi:hypothetical protein
MALSRSRVASGAQGSSRHGRSTRGAGRSPARSPSNGATPAPTRYAAAASRSASSGSLGLSGADVAYIVLAFLLLALTALLTVRLARRPGGAGGA